MHITRPVFFPTSSARPDRTRTKAAARSRAMFQSPGYLVGLRAIIKGMQNEPALNGQEAAVKSFEASRGQYQIELSGGRTIEVKEENLKFVFSAPAATRSPRTKPPVHARFSLLAPLLAPPPSNFQFAAAASAASGPSTAAGSLPLTLHAVLLQYGMHMYNQRWPTVQADLGRVGIDGNHLESLSQLGAGINTTINSPPAQWCTYLQQHWGLSLSAAQAICSDATSAYTRAPPQAPSLAASQAAQQAPISTRKAPLRAAPAVGPASASQPAGGSGTSKKPKAVLAAEDGLSLEPVDDSDPVTWNGLSRLMKTNRDWLGKGHDASQGQMPYELQLVRAWKLQNPRRDARYESGTKGMQDEMDRLKAKDKLTGRQMGQPVLTADAAAALPLTTPLQKPLNEVLLLHGTQPGVLFTLLANGMSERFSGTNAGTNFGDGAYLAEDIGKADQYVKVDRKYGEHQDLHDRLYGHTYRHPDDVYYTLVCRVALGLPLRTRKSGKHATSCDAPPGQLHSYEKVFPPGTTRELATVPGVTPPIHYHSLVAECGEVISRYREFVIFRAADYVCPLYLIAYKRKLV